MRRMRVPSRGLGALLSLLLFLFTTAAGLSAMRLRAEIMRGDVNSDGAIGADDAQAVLAQVVGRTLPTGFTLLPNGDADGNGVIEAVDAQIILSHVVGRDVAQFPVGKPLVSTAVLVSPSSLSLTVGGSQKLSASVTGNANTAVTWSSDNAGIASVDAQGQVSGKAVGSTLVWATSVADNSKRASAQINVGVAPVASVEVSPTAATLQIGTDRQLSATLKDAQGNTLSGRAISWSSNNTAVATVDQSGKVTAKTEGKATITATSESKSATSEITVVPQPPAPVATVEISPTTASVQAGSSTQLSATTKDASGNTLTGRSISWSSNNTSIATVDQTGRVTGVAEGSAQITASSEGKSGTATVNVSRAAVAPSLVLSQSSISFAAQQNGSNPTAQTVSITNGGDGTLQGLQASVSQGASWLTASIAPQTATSTSAATLTLTASTAGLQAGDYNATVTVSSTTANVVSKQVSVSFTVTTQPPPTAPSNLTAATSGGLPIALSWSDNSQNESEFRIERKGSTGDFAQIGTAAANATSYTDNSLTTQDTYTYRVRACTASGTCSAFSNEASVRNGPRATTQPATGITATGATLNGMVMSSTGGRYAFSYGTTTALGSSTELTTMGSSPTVSAAVTNLQPNTKYYFRVRFISTQQLTAEGDILEFATGAAPAPAAPSNAVLHPPLFSWQNGRVLMSWTDNSTDETEFRIERKVGNTGTWGQIGTRPGNTTSGTTVGPDTTSYALGVGPTYFRVRACNAAGSCSGYSNEPMAALPTVTTTAATAVGPDSARLNATVDGHGFTRTFWFEYSKDAALSGATKSSEVASTNTGISYPNWDITRLYGSTPYHYRITVRNQWGTTIGNTVSFTTQPAQAPTVTTDSASMLTSTSARLHGTIDGNGADYTSWAEYGTTSALGLTACSETQSTQPGTASWSCNRAGLNPGTTYFYRQAVRNNFGTFYGATKSFTTPAASGSISPSFSISGTGSGSTNVAQPDTPAPSQPSETPKAEAAPTPPQP